MIFFKLNRVTVRHKSFKNLR